MTNRKILTDSEQLRQELIDTCMHLLETGHFTGTWGNISIRLKDGFLVTPSGLEYEDTTTKDLVVVSDSGKVIGGSRIPSSETLMHLELMKKRPDFGAIIHTHSLYLSVLACAQKSLPVIIEDMAQIAADKVNCTPYIPSGSHTELAEIVCKTIGDSSQAVLIANHGAVVGAIDLKQAVVTLKILEKAAAIYIKALPLGGAVEIPPTSIKRVRDAFVKSYGKEDVTKISNPNK